MPKSMVTAGEIMRPCHTWGIAWRIRDRADWGWRLWRPLNEGERWTFMFVEEAWAKIVALQAENSSTPTRTCVDFKAVRLEIAATQGWGTEGPGPTEAVA